MRNPLSTLSIPLFLSLFPACGEQTDPTAMGEPDAPIAGTSGVEPEPVEPAATSPEASEPNTDEPEATTAGSGAIEPESAEPESSEPETAEPEPVEPEPSTGEEICTLGEGERWAYYHSNGGWTETITVGPAEQYEGEQVYRVGDTPNPADNLRSDSLMVEKNGRILRLYKEVYWVSPSNGSETLDSSVTYGVGFLRCSEAWASAEPGFSETPGYERIETVAGAPPKTAEARSHTFTVEGRESVTLASGTTFANCVKVRRSKDWAAAGGADAEEKLFWFCPGIGKVKEVNVESGSTEELVPD